MTVDITTLIARAEITDVLTRYVRGADRNDWALVRSCYHADATDDHGLYSGDVDGLMVFLQTLAAQIRSTSHQLGPPLVEVDGDMARAETYCFGWYERAARDGSIWSIAQGVRYLDVLARRDGRWAIARRVVVLDWERTFQPSETPPPASSWQRGARGTTDPSADFWAS